MAIQTLNVTKSGNGRGTITSDVGVIDCGSVCSSAEIAGNTVTLTATPARGSVFVRWTGDLISTNNPASYVQTLNPTNINAEFVRAKRKKIKGFLPNQNDIYFSPDTFPNGIPEVLPYNGINYVYTGIVTTPTGQNWVKFSNPSTARGGSQMVEPPIKTNRVSGGGKGGAL